MIDNKNIICDENVKKFVDLCCKKTEQKNLRVGIKEIYLVYEKWCKDNNINNNLTCKNFKQEYEKNGSKYETSKGVDINNNSGKRGYNIILNYKKKINKSLYTNKQDSKNTKVEIDNDEVVNVMV